MFTWELPAVSPDICVCCGKAARFHEVRAAATPFPPSCDTRNCERFRRGRFRCSVSNALELMHLTPVRELFGALATAACLALPNPSFGQRADENALTAA